MLTTKCLVTGFVLDADGEPVAGGFLNLWPRSGRVSLSVDTTALISTAVVKAEIEAQGQVSVELNPGQYYAQVSDSKGKRTPRFEVVVPNAEAADFGDLLEGALVPPPTLPRLPAGQPGQVVSYDADGNPVAVDANIDDSDLRQIIADLRARLEILESGTTPISQTVWTLNGEPFAWTVNDQPFTWTGV